MAMASSDPHDRFHGHPAPIAIPIPRQMDDETLTRPTDTETPSSLEKAESNTSATTEGDTEADLDDNSHVPRLSLLKLFWFFFHHFGLFAWGGSVTQIALIKERLVIQDGWITVERFQRVYSIYQVLPGPEAAELCMFFGCLSAGRCGGMVAGLGYILPGFVLTLLASYLYASASFDNAHVKAAFKTLQPMVAAMVRLICSDGESAHEW